MGAAMGGTAPCRHTSDDTAPDGSTSATSPDIREVVRGTSKRKNWVKTLGSSGYQEAVGTARALAVAHDRLISRERSLSHEKRRVNHRYGRHRGGWNDAEFWDQYAAHMNTLAPRLDHLPLDGAPGVTQEQMAVAIFRAKAHAREMSAHAARKRALVAKVAPAAPGSFLAAFCRSGSVMLRGHLTT